MYKKVLVPLDGSELAACALPHVMNLAKDGSVGEIILLNVVVIELPLASITTGDVGIGLDFDFNAFRKDHFDKSRKYLADMQSKLSSEGIKVTTASVEDNRPAHAITEYARNNGVDMIVIASHGYTGMKKLMFGSVAHNILHFSHVPVLLIRPESCRV